MGCGLQHCAELVDVFACDVTENDVAKTVLGEGMQVERVRLGVVWRCVKGDQIFREDEDGDLVFANLIDEMRTGNLPEISDASADESEVGVLQFGEIEGKRNLSLEPRFHRV